MIKLWGMLAGSLLYMEIVYHLGCFGLAPGNPVFALSLVVCLSGLEILLVGSVAKKWKKPLFWIMMGAEYVLFAAQFVYYKIFRQPLMLEAAFRGGQDALTNYWREALDGIVKSIPFLLLLAIPMLISGALFLLKRWKLPVFHSIERLRCMLVAGVGLIAALMTIFIGKYLEADYYEDYSEFFDPLTVASNMGVLTLAQRDIAVTVENGVKGIFAGFTKGSGNSGKNEPSQPSEGTGAPSLEETGTEGTGESNVPGSEEQPVEVPVDISPNQLTIDFEQLKAAADSKESTWLAEYMEGLVPTNRNEYTGIFEGYNLIYLTLEGFSPYAVRQDLTPTLYRLVNTGFVFTQFYAPIWQTSTSDGEYINCTGLIPDGQFSMRKSGVNDMAFTLPRYFAEQGVSSMAYHNNSLSYYDRNVTHPNMGYDFKGAKLGDLTEAEWGSKVFPMEHPDAWPASDFEMMQGTVSDYIGMDRFHAYYMTVSGHMNYNFKGNAMSAKNKEAVAGLNMSENAQAYIACNIELDKALEYLLEQLEAAGKLSNTVICMSADHYPYGMTESEYEELAGKKLSDNLDLYRNNLVLWNADMEAEPVVVDKVCGSMDIVPTLLNLFGFDYDSRLYAGRDIFSDEEGMVIFNDKSFITDTVIYNRKAKQTVWKDDMAQIGSGVSVSDNDPNLPVEEQVKRVEGKRQVLEGEEARGAYFDGKKQDVKNRYQFSAFVLQKNYYKQLKEAMQ